MEETTSKPKNIHSTIAELKKKLGLDKCTVIHEPIKVKKDGKHLYKVAGYNYPLKPETLERLNIPNHRILYEVSRAEWIEEMRNIWDTQDDRPSEGEALEDLYPWGYEK